MIIFGWLFVGLDVLVVAGAAVKFFWWDKR